MPFYTDGVVPWNSLDDNTRAPLSSERETGYPCGEADQQLFNWTAGWPIGNIWDMILKSGITPDVTKLLDLARAVRSQRLNFFMGAGTANAVSITMDPAPADWADLVGVPLRVIPVEANTGAATLAVAGLTGTRPIVSRFGGVLVGGELAGPVSMVYDGTRLWADVTEPRLTTNGTFYVRPDGSDSNNGLSNTAAGAFATLQKAVDTVSRINRNGFELNIQVANGTYAGFVTKPLLGPGSTRITGNVTTPGSVVLNGASGSAGITVLHPGYNITGFRPVGASGQSHFYVLGALVNIGNMEWTSVTVGSHMAVGNAGTLIIDGQQRFVGNANQGHMFAADGGTIRGGLNPSLVIPTTPLAVGDWAIATNGFINLIYVGGISGAGNIASGRKFSVSANGVINVQGAGVNYFPGVTPGVAASGGQYV